MMKALIADDHQENLYLLETILKNKGFTVVSTGDGQQAFDSALREHPDIIITDILMPVMDGFQLSKRIRSTPELKDIPIIVYTATYTGKQDEQLALSMGADIFLVKPVEPEILINYIEALLSKNQDSHSMDHEASHASEGEVLTLYNQRLINKLEEKMSQLEDEIRQKNKVQSQLSESEMRYRNILEQMDEGYFELSVNGSFLFVNPAASRIIGRETDEVEELSLFDLLIPSRIQQVRHLLHQIAETGEHLGSITATIIKKDGTQRQIESSLAPVYDKQQSLSGFRGVFKDITDQATQEAKQRDLEHQLLESQKLELMGNFAGGIAHDFNNLLSVISGYADIARSVQELPETASQSLEQILQAVDKARDMISHLLSFSRKQPLHRQQIDIKNWLERSLPLYNMIAGEHVAIDWQIPDDIQPIFMDAVQLDQVFSNLVANARDALSGSGNISITAQNVEHPDIGKSVQLIFSDHGCGMDDQTRQQIFEPFFTTKEHGKGTGLGLSAVNNIIQQTGGTITCDSTPGEGTTFTVSLPASPLESRRTTAENTDVEQTLTIMLVDDETAVREMSVLMLESMGYRVRSAASAQQALTMLEDQPAQMLITDVVMHGMDGFTLAEICRERQLVEHILCMTGYASQLDEQKQHTFHILCKPFTKAELQNSIQELIPLT
jgi:PAS domain S-box-containing protein